MISLFLLLALGPLPHLLQEGEVDRILADFKRERDKARDQASYDKAVREAMKALEDHLARNPRASDAPKALAHLGDFQNAEGQTEKAAASYARILKDYPKASEVPPALLSLAEIRLRQERDAEAADYCDRFLRDHPDHESAPYARLFLALTKYYRGRHDEAVQELQNLRKDLKGNQLEWMIATQLAVLHHLSGSQKEADTLLEEIIRNAPDKSHVEQMRRLLTGYTAVGKPAPEPDHQDFSLKDQRGKVVVLYFYYSFVPLAEGELGFLRELSEKTKGRDVRIVGVSLDPVPKEFESFRRLRKIPWTLLYDGNRFEGKIAKRFEVQSLPHLLVIDKKGVIRFHNVSGRDLRIGVERLLQEE